MHRGKVLTDTDITSCGDSGTYGLVIWLGTRNEKLARKKAREIENDYKKNQFKVRDNSRK